MRFGRKTSFAAGAIVALVIGSGSAYAATGGKLVLGYGNSAGKTTTLTNGNGTAMTFNSKAGTPSIRVNRTTKVPNLNADRIDNLDSTQLALVSASTRVFDAQGEFVDGDNDGVLDTAWAYAQCPDGWKRTGGGFADQTSTGYVWWNAPNTSHSWIVFASLAEGAEDFSGGLSAYVVCYHPRGGGNAAGYRTTEPSAPKLTAEQLELAGRRAAARNN